MIPFKLIAQTAVAVCSLGAVWFAVGTGSASAQQRVGVGQGSVTRVSGQGNPMPYLGSFGPGGTAMTVDESFLYIVRGSEVFKLRKSDLAVVATGMLPSRPAQLGGGGIQAVPGNGFGGFGGGGGTVPPPPTTPPPSRL